MMANKRTLLYLKNVSRASPLGARDLAADLSSAISRWLYGGDGHETGPFAAKPSVLSGSHPGLLPLRTAALAPLAVGLDDVGARAPLAPVARNFFLQLKKTKQTRWVFDY